jgi:hypothetical protein
LDRGGVVKRGDVILGGNRHGVRSAAEASRELRAVKVFTSSWSCRKKE